MGIEFLGVLKANEGERPIVIAIERLDILEVSTSKRLPLTSTLSKSSGSSYISKVVPIPIIFAVLVIVVVLTLFSYY